MVVQIDPRLTVDCYEPLLNGRTNRDLGVYAIEAKNSIEECNERFEVIRSIGK